MSIDVGRFPVQIESLTAAIDVLLEMIPSLDVGVRQIDARATLLARVPPADGSSAPRDALLAQIGWSHADRLVAWYTLDGMAILHSALSVRANGAPLTVGRWLFGASSDAPPRARAELERVVAGGIPVPSGMGSPTFLDAHGRRYIWVDAPEPQDAGDRDRDREVALFCHAPYARDETRLAFADSQHAALPQVGDFLQMVLATPSRDRGLATVRGLVTMVDVEAGGTERSATARVVVRGIF